MASSDGVERAVSRLAGAIAFAVALATPVLFAWDEYNEAVARLEAEAELQAKAVTAFVGRNPAAWQLPTDRLRNLLEENRALGGTTSIFDLEGVLIARAAVPTEWPVLAREAPFFDFGNTAGMVEVRASARRILYHTLPVLIVSTLLGLLIYGPLRRMPLRAFNAATQELEASESRYRQLVERAPVGIVKHRHGTIEFANPAFIALVGATSGDDVVGRDYLDFVVPEQRGEAAGIIVELSAGAATVPLRWQRLQRQDGSIVETEMTGVSGRDGASWVAQIIVTDVTMHRRSQELLRRSRDQLLAQQRALMAITRSELFAAGDCNAMFRSLTEMAAKQQGVERVSLWRFNQARNAILCLDLYELSRDRHSSAGALQMEAFPRYLEAIRSEEAVVADDALADELTRELADSYLRPLGIGSMLDIPIRLRGVTEGVLCHEHVGPAISWTLEQRMFAVATGNLAALAIEQGARHQAEEEGQALTTDLERRLRRCDAELEAALGDLESVTRNLAQERRLTLEEVDLGDLARRALARLKEREPQRPVESVVQSGLTARCDRVLMAIALDRLIVDAWQAASASGAGGVEIGQAPVDGRRAFYVREHGATPGEPVAVTVGHSDSGPGGAGAHDTKKAGYAAACPIIERHGGRIWSESAPGGGTCIWFTLEPGAGG